MEGCKKIYKKSFDRFSIMIWPDNIEDIIFLYKWKVKLAKYTVFIKSAIDLLEVLKVDYNLVTLGI